MPGAQRAHALSLRSFADRSRSRARARARSRAASLASIFLQASIASPIPGMPHPLTIATDDSIPIDESPIPHPSQLTPTVSPRDRRHRPMLYPCTEIP